MRISNEFHAPSWSWVALCGEISFLMRTPGGHDNLLITGLGFKSRIQCESTDSLKECKGTCVSGSVSFEGPVQKLIRSTKLKDLRIEGYPNEPITEGRLLEGILGPTLVSDFAIPRVDELGNEVPSPHDSLVPDHTEILVEESGCIVGFFIPDLENELKEAREQLPVICVGIKRWQDPNSRQEDTIEILGLREICHSTMTFGRLGRGRIICSGWLQKCKTMYLTIILGMLTSVSNLLWCLDQLMGFRELSVIYDTVIQFCLRYPAFSSSYSSTYAVPRVENWTRHGKSA